MFKFATQNHKRRPPRLRLKMGIISFANSNPQVKSVKCGNVVNPPVFGVRIVSMLSMESSE